MRQLYDQLKDTYRLTEYGERHPGQAAAQVPAERLTSLLTQLRDAHGFSHLVLMTCVDWLEQGQFQVTYILHNHTRRQDFILKVRVDRAHPVLPSIHTLWKQARVYQRELHEMFGLEFPGSPGIDEPMILESWQGPPPMRRDFDTRKFSEEHYSHRPRSHSEPEARMKEQLYPED